jgi:protein-tyrosine phosphatase
MKSPGNRIEVLFVCMGNICRSPTAEGVLRKTAERAGMGSGIVVDSAGTHEFHAGHPPDKRATAAALRRGYEIGRLRARRFSVADFARFTWILAMDEDNLRELEAMRPPDYQGHLGLFLDFAPEAGVREVPDPYYGPPEGFERVLDLIEAASAGFIARLRQGSG